MTEKLGLSADELLTTTRAVRRRLDVTRPVPREVLEECLEIALQAPNGSNRNTWRWVIIDDPQMIAKLADEYKAAMGLLNDGSLMPGRPDGTDVVMQASMWGSIIQAVWSFMLALRERGLGSIWATVTSRREREIAELLGIPFEEYTQVGFFPIAYTEGTQFKKAWRKPVSEVLSYNTF
jgi:nitroreductase